MDVTISNPTSTNPRWMVTITAPSGAKMVFAGGCISSAEAEIVAAAASKVVIDKVGKLTTQDWMRG